MDTTNEISFTITGMPTITVQVVAQLYEATKAGRIAFNQQNGMAYVTGMVPPMGQQTTITLPPIAEWLGDIIGYLIGGAHETMLQAAVQEQQMAVQRTAEQFRLAMSQAVVKVEGNQ